MDEEILTCVQSIFGDNVKIVDCEKNASVLEEELVCINGIPVKLNSLNGDDASAIKIALLEGETPSVDLLNKLLQEAGLLQQPMCLETTLSVKSTLTTKQQVNVSKHGQLLDAHSSQTKEDCIYQTQEKLVWQPPPPTLCKRLRETQACEQLTAGNSSSTITTSSTTTTTSEQSQTISNDSGSQLQPEPQLAATCSGASLYNATYTSGQGLWPTNSLATAADDNISHLTADLSIDSGYPQQEYKQPVITKTEELIVYKNGALVSGTVEALLALLVPRHNYFPDTGFCYTFLLSARLFRPVEQLFAQMTQIWQSRHDLLDLDTTEHTKSVNNLLRLLLHWLDNFPTDLQLHKFKMQLEQLKQYLPDTELKPNFMQKLDNMQQTMIEMKAEAEKTAKNLTEFQTKIMCLKSMCSESLQLAQHLLAVELKFLSQISAEQLLLETGAKAIECYKLWTQQLTQLVAQHILQFTKKKQRVAILKYWLETAQICYNNYNFNSLWSILQAFQVPAVARLKKMWSKIDVASLTALQAQLNVAENYANYRASLQAAKLHAHNRASDPYVIVPYFHVLQADIIVLAKNCTIQGLPNAHIDYGKCLELSHFVQNEFEKLRRHMPKFATSDEVIALLQTAVIAPICDADTQMQWSYACESPHNAEEKKHLKALKSKHKACK